MLFGTQNGFVNMTSGFTILGVSNGDLTGWSVSGAGDVNNDTQSDLIIGAPYPQSTGAAYVIYGRGPPYGVIDLSNLLPTEGYAIYGVTNSDCLGLSVSSAGE